ncbi:MAG: hypothetical protein RL659_327 [Pseudomonadota bacterium]
MPALLPHIDPDGLLEFSVVYTDRALNHMSKRFQGVMQDISGILNWCQAAALLAWKPWRVNLPMAKKSWSFAMAGSVTGGHKFLTWAVFPVNPLS